MNTKQNKGSIKLERTPGTKRKSQLGNVSQNQTGACDSINEESLMDWDPPRFRIQNYSPGFEGLDSRHVIFQLPTCRSKRRGPRHFHAHRVNKLPYQITDLFLRNVSWHTSAITSYFYTRQLSKNTFEYSSPWRRFITWKISISELFVNFFKAVAQIIHWNLN
jgi:hypothetical protein